MRKSILFTLLCLTGMGAMQTAQAANEVYSEFVEATETLTYYYDGQREARTGTTELYNWNSVPFSGYADKVTKAVVDPSMADALMTSMRNMFYGLKNMTGIEGLNHLNTSSVTDMESMFYYCQKLTSLDLSKFNTANVTSMGYMFSNCYALTSLNLTSFNTANVMDMSYMFSHCEALTSLNLTSFNTGKVSAIARMFHNCSELTTIWCNDDWSVGSFSGNMFLGSKKLVGEKGNRI